MSSTFRNFQKPYGAFTGTATVTFPKGTYKPVSVSKEL